MLRYATACALLVAAAGCAATPETGSNPNTGATVILNSQSSLDASITGGGEPSLDVVRAPSERVLTLVHEAYTALGIATQVDPRGRLVSSGATELRARIEGKRTSTYLNCGTSAVGQQAADVHRVTLAARSYVSPTTDGTGSEVRTILEASARAVGGGSTTPVRCASTGELERRLIQLVQARL